jgi:hypothetical protein
LVALTLAGLLAPLLLTPWRAADAATTDYIPELHRWHDAAIASFLGFLAVGCLLAAIPRPRQTPLLVQAPLLGFAILAVFTLYPLNAPVLIMMIVSGGLVFATYPAPLALLTLRGGERVSRPLLAVALTATIPLLLDTWTNIRLQQTDVSEHATHRHWHGIAALTLILIVTGYLVASRRAGWRALGVITGLTYLNLGAAALALPNHDGSWGVTGGYLSLTAGAAFLVVTTLVAFRARTIHPSEA